MSTGPSEKAAAQLFFKNLKKAIERGNFSQGDELTVAGAISSYLKAGGEDRFFDPILVKLGRLPAAGLTQKDFDDTAEELYPNAPGSTKNRNFFTPLIAALKHSSIEPQIKRPIGSKGTPRHCYLLPEACQRVIDAAAEISKSDIEDELPLILLITNLTGLRLSEALSIDPGNVRPDEDTVFVGHTKNGEPRSVYLPPAAMDALTAFLATHERQDRVFRSYKGSRLYKKVHEAYELAGVDHQGAPFHIMRHTFGRNMTRLGADLVATEIWKSRQAADVYKHTLPSEEARKAAQLPGAGEKKNRA